MSKRKQLAKPRNMAAKALGDRLFAPRVVKNGKAYSRKIKHRKGEIGNDTAPLFVCVFSSDRIHTNELKIR